MALQIGRLIELCKMVDSCDNCIFKNCPFVLLYKKEPKFPSNELRALGTTRDDIKDLLTPEDFIDKMNDIKLDIEQSHRKKNEHAEKGIEIALSILNQFGYNKGADIFRTTFL